MRFFGLLVAVAAPLACVSWIVVLALHCCILSATIGALVFPLGIAAAVLTMALVVCFWLETRRSV